MKKLLLATAAGALLAGAAGAEEIKLGTSLGFTGPLESMAPPMQAGVELAAKEISDSGLLLDGSTVAVVQGDSTCIDAAAASATVERLITAEGVKGIIGGMCFENWIAYVIAYAVISIIPGPSVFMVIGQSLSRGTRAAIACITGDLAGGVIVMTASYLGLGLLLASSSMAFMVLKWAGVIYMAWLGVQQIRAARNLLEITPIRTASAQGSLGAGFLTGVLNPKAIMFYMAFLAQFIEPTAPQLPQFMILMATSTLVVAIVLGGYALLAARVSARLQSLRARKRMGYAG